MGQSMQPNRHGNTPMRKRVVCVCVRERDREKRKGKVTREAQTNTHTERDEYKQSYREGSALAHLDIC